MAITSKKTLKALLISMLAMLVCYVLLVIAFPSHISVRLYALAVFLFVGLLGYLLGSLHRDRQVWYLVNDLKSQVKNKELAQEKLALSTLRLRRQNETLAALTAEYLKSWEYPEQVFRHISEVAARTLDVERVSFWLFSDDYQEMLCVDLYDRSTNRHSEGELIYAKALPNYLASLSTQRVMVANDASAHEIAKELANQYLTENNIGAFLNGIIWWNERVVGLIALEHVGGPREWTLDEQNFAGSMADLGRLIVETDRRRLVETELLRHRNHLEELVKQRTVALENTAKTSRFLVDRASVCILYMNSKTEVIDINPETELVSGYKSADVVGKTFYELFSNKTIRAQHLALFKRVLAGEKLQGVDLQMQGADGIVKDYSVSVSLEMDEDGNPVIISIAQDMSKQKALETSLITAKQAAESADWIKSMFVASMSHELRTPLNSIIGFIGVVLQGMSGPLNEKQKEQLGRAYGSAKHLLSLISDVIDISKIEAGYLQVNVERFNVLPLLLEAEQVVRHIAEEKKLLVEIDCEKTIALETDRKRLYQTVLNVMSNAVKYTEKGSVSVKVQLKEDKLLIITQDTGIGMTEAALANLFKPFERADSRLRIKTLGTGLGLYLTKKILTQLLGGTIEVESQPELGSTFIISVPLSAPKVHLDVDSSVLERPKHDHSAHY